VITKVYTKEDSMSVAIDLLKSDFVGIKEARASITIDKLKKVMVFTDHGRPVSVSVPFEDMMELLDMLEEVSDSETVATVLDARKARQRKEKSVSVSTAFEEFKKSR